MKRVTRFLILSVVILSFTTCHKYPQGGWSRKANEKIKGKSSVLSKRWRLNSYKVNQVEIISEITSDLKYDIPISTIAFSRNLIDPDVINCQTEVFAYLCALADKDNVFSASEQPTGFVCNNDSCQFNIFNPTNKAIGLSANWKILKLTETEFKLALVDQFIYEIRLVAI